MVLGEGGGGESLFILFLVSGVPVFLGGEAGGSDPPRPFSPPTTSPPLLAEKRGPRASQRIASQRNAAHWEPARLGGE